MSFLETYLTPGDKMKILKPYLQDTPNEILEYHFLNP